MTGTAAIWPRFEPESESSGRWAALARYVVPEMLYADNLLIDRPSGPNDASDRIVLEGMFGRLAQMKLRYRRAEWAAARRGNQLIRHITWVKSEGGNCADLSVIFAAGLLRAGVVPLLAVTRDRGHIFVMVAPGQLPLTSAGRPAAVTGTVRHRSDDSPGVLEVDDPGAICSALADGSLVAVDCVGVTDPEASYAESRNCLEHIEERMLLLDVAFLHANGFPPFGAPGEWPSVQRFPPGMTGTPELYGAQAQLYNELRGFDGEMLVIGGQPGQGKSTVARALVDAVPNAAGWFLNAADPQALVDSLAQAELMHTGVDPGELERSDREGFALEALGRLRRSDRPWLVVLDNADGETRHLLKYLPRPKAGQTLVITSATGETTAGDETTSGPDGWVRVGARRYDLGAVEAADMALELEPLTGLIDGRALLLRAFQLLFVSAPDLDADDVLTLAPSPARVPTEIVGPTAFWRALPRTAGWEPTLHPRLAALAAQLPTVGLSVALLQRLTGAAPDVIERLSSFGLVTSATGSEPQLTMHRLFARTVNWNLEHGEPAPAAGSQSTLLEQVAMDLLNDEDAVELFGLHSDRAGATALLARLGDFVERGGNDERLLLGLRNLGRILELRGDTILSLEAYELMVGLLTADTHPELRAEYYHAYARFHYRHKPKGVDRQRWLEDGLARARDALALARDDEESVGRFLAMQGLLQKSLASFPGQHKTELELLMKALEVIEEAHQRRDARLAPVKLVNPEWARSYYNLAGTYVPLAQADPAQAQAYLDKAEHVYTTVRDLRIEIYQSRVHPHIASCIQGLGMVSYYRAMLVATTDEERSHWLRLATHWLDEALGQWEALEGADDGTDAGKASALLAKVALVRASHAEIRLADETSGGDPDGLSDTVAPLVAQTIKELGWRHQPRTSPKT